MNATGGGFVMDGGKQSENSGILRTALDGNGSLAGSGEHALDNGNVKPLRDNTGTQADEAGAGEDKTVEGGIGGELAQAGGHVAANVLNAQVRAEGKKLGGTAGAGRGDNRTEREGGQTVGSFGNQDIGGIGPLGNGGEDETGGHFDREVLQTVHGGVDLATKERLLKLAGEKPLLQRAGLGKADVEAAVAGGPDDPGLDGRAGMGGLKSGSHKTSLGEGEIAAPRTKDKIFHGRSS